MIPVFLSAAFLISSFSVTLASYGIEPATIHPSRPSSCFNKETNAFYEDGDSWQVKGCAVASCLKVSQSSGKSQMMISYESCGSVGHEEGCYTQVNKDAEYPDCCPEVVCPDSSEQDDYNKIYDLGGLNVNNDIIPITSGSGSINGTRVRDEKDAENFYTEIAREWLKRLEDSDLARSSENEIDLQSLDDSSEESSIDQNRRTDNLFRRKPSPRLFYMY